MTHIKNILRNMRRELCTSVPELAFVGKDRGELAGANPAVALPCALLDVRSAGYSQQARGGVLADVVLTITVAASDAASETPYRTLDLLERIRTALHLFSADEGAQLLCTELRKVDAANLSECYELTCRTVFETGGTLSATHPVHAVGLEVR